MTSRERMTAYNHALFREIVDAISDNNDDISMTLKHNAMIIEVTGSRNKLWVTVSDYIGVYASVGNKDVEYVYLDMNWYYELNFDKYKIRTITLFTYLITEAVKFKYDENLRNLDICCECIERYLQEHLYKMTDELDRWLKTI